MTSPDRKFIDDLTRTVLNTWNSDEELLDNTNQFEFEGSDEEIRSKFELYLESLLFAIKQSHSNSSEHLESTKKPDYLSTFIKAWQTTKNYTIWKEKLDSREFPDSVKYTFAL